MFFTQFKNINLKMMVFFWIPNSSTSLVNFSFSLNLIKTCPWWYATFTIPLFFILTISSYRLTISAAFSGAYISLTSLFRSSNSTNSSIVIESNNFVFISSFHKRFAFLLSVRPLHIYKQKNKHFSTKSKNKKYLSKLTFRF